MIWANVSNPLEKADQRYDLESDSTDRIDIAGDIFSYPPLFFQVTIQNNLIINKLRSDREISRLDLEISRPLC